MRSFWLSTALGAAAVLAQDIGSCPGYAASNVKQSDRKITADLTLDGEPCDVYGDDIKDLQLLVEYQTGVYHRLMGNGACASSLGSPVKLTPSRKPVTCQNLRCREARVPDPQRPVGDARV